MILAAYFLGVIIGGFAGYHIGQRRMYMKTKRYFKAADKVLDDLRRRTESLQERTEEHNKNVTQLYDTVRKHIKKD